MNFKHIEQGAHRLLTLRQPPEGKTADAPETASIVALPLGGRIKVAPFRGDLHFLKFMSVGQVPEYEKMLTSPMPPAPSGDWIS